MDRERLEMIRKEHDGIIPPWRIHPDNVTKLIDALERVLDYCDAAEKIYSDAAFKVPGMPLGDALISTTGVRDVLRMKGKYADG